MACAGNCYCTLHYKLSALSQVQILGGKVTQKWRAILTLSFIRYNIYLWGEFWPNFFWFSRDFSKILTTDFHSSAQLWVIQSNMAEHRSRDTSAVTSLCAARASLDQWDHSPGWSSGQDQSEASDWACWKCTLGAVPGASPPPPWARAEVLDWPDTERLEITPRHEQRAGELHSEEEEDSSWHQEVSIMIQESWWRIFLTVSPLRLCVHRVMSPLLCTPARTRGTGVTSLELRFRSFLKDS